MNCIMVVSPSLLLAYISIVGIKPRMPVVRFWSYIFEGFQRRHINA